MAFKVSTGLRDHMLDTGSFKAGMDLGFLNIYEGAEPADADAALGGANLLCTLSVDGLGTGLTWEAAAVSGVLSKATAETWQGTNVDSGTATFFRFVAAGDTGGASTTELRVQGTVGLVGAELNLSSVTLTVSAVQTVNHFNVALPTL
jgi:acyl dehydratase